MTYTVWQLPNNTYAPIKFFQGIVHTLISVRLIYFEEHQL